MLLPRLLAPAAAFLALIAPLFAQIKVEVSWGSTIFEERMILSDGTSLDPTNLIIEFGSFDNNFIPNYSNMDQWVSQWRIFDAIRDTDPGVATTDADGNDAFTNNGNDDTARYAGMAHMLLDTTSDSEDAGSYTFSPGEQAYVFIRTSDDFLPTSEWLLFTSRNDSQHVGDAVWEFPAVTGGQPQFSVAWWLDDADKAIFGAIGGGDGGGGDTGAGSFTDSSTNFALRLHTIPEPEGWLLALIPSALLLVRRRTPW